MATTTGSMSYERLAALLHESSFHRTLGLELLAPDLSRQVIVIRMMFAPAVEAVPGIGQFHGGPIASLFDTAGDFALIQTLGHGIQTSRSQSSTCGRPQGLG